MDGPPAPASEQALLVDTALQPPPTHTDAPIAVPEPGTPEPAEVPIAVAEADDSDSAPAPENQPETLALQAGPLSPPLADPALTTVPFSPAPGPDPLAAVANGPLPGPADDAASEAELMTLIHQVSGTPYVWGGNTAAGTDCSGLASWVSNAATGRPVFGDRFTPVTRKLPFWNGASNTGLAPGALVIGWNDHHTAVTLADGTPVSSGEGGGVKSVAEELIRLSSLITCFCRWRRSRQKVTQLRWMPQRWSMPWTRGANSCASSGTGW